MKSEEAHRVICQRTFRPQHFGLESTLHLVGELHNKYLILQNPSRGPPKISPKSPGSGPQVRHAPYPKPISQFCPPEIISPSFLTLFR